MSAVPVATNDIRRLLVANRGEIAVRIIKACRSLGIEAIAAVSEADHESAAARMADGAVLIGPGPAAQSYLCPEKLIAAALDTGCDAIHPGYGFLSERAHFVRACMAANLVFVGPSPEAIEAMGEKITAVQLAEKARVPRVPGSAALESAGAAKEFAQKVGLPILIKASAGGGGRGMRVVHDLAQIEASFNAATSEAQSAFGDSAVYAEKYIKRARHIEIQIMADAHGNFVHLGERECSTQRRYQKLIEEAPSPSLNEETRLKLGTYALELARSVSYQGAGTVEFIMDEEAGEFYFLEMNTRIQVEHPITEMITGLDLVAEQIRVACGLPLSFTQEDVALKGHAIECRINAENPLKGFIPSPGTISVWEQPEFDGLRIDTHCSAGSRIPPFYDSLIAKVIVHDVNRERAIEKMLRALSELKIQGPATTTDFHRGVLSHDDFRAARVTTRWVEETFIPQWHASEKERDAIQ